MSSEVDAKVNLPTYDELLWPTLQGLKQMGGSGTIQEIVDRVVQIGGYTDAQQSVIHRKGPVTEIAYRAAWARTYLKFVGALENSSRGVWAITDYGRGLTEADMAGIPGRVRAMNPRKPGRDRPPPDDGESPELKPRRFSSTVFDEWRDELLNVLLSSPPDSFERLCQRLLRESGFTKVEVTGRSGDGGIDGIGVLRISLLSFQVFFQCKRYKGSVGAGDVRNFRGAMVGRTDKGLLITTGSYTPDAKKEATRDGAPVIDLIDGDYLCNLLKDFRLCVSTQQVEEVSIDSQWFTEI